MFATLVRALPYSLRDHPRADGTSVMVTVTGSGGGSWTTVALDGRWTVTDEAPNAPDARVTLDGAVAWRLWTRGIDPLEAAMRAVGDEVLTAAVRQMVSIIR